MIWLQPSSPFTVWGSLSTGRAYRFKWKMRACSRHLEGAQLVIHTGASLFNCKGLTLLDKKLILVFVSYPLFHKMNTKQNLFLRKSLELLGMIKRFHSNDKQNPIISILNAESCNLLKPIDRPRITSANLCHELSVGI